MMIVAQDPIGFRASATLRGILLGAKVEVVHLRDNADEGQYISNLKKNYQLIVPGNEMKAEYVWLGDNIYNFTDPDWLLGATLDTTGWIQQNGLILRGHNLVWPRDQRLPKWLLEQESSITPDKAKSLLSDYIHTIVGRYRGKILWWDVINEAIDDRKNTNPFNLRDSFWLRKLGVDFLKYAFIFAHEADPNVQLYYNDYAIESLGFKANRTYELISWLKSEGVPIHSLGMQWHIEVSANVTSGDAYYQNAQQFIDLGINFMVTELDISIPMKNGTPINPADIEKQGILYGSIMNYMLYFFPKCAAMLTWGFTDRHSGVPVFSNYTKGAALPLDSFFKPKPAYWKMQEELARVLPNGIYCLSPQAQLQKYLGTSDNETSSSVQLYDGGCNSTNKQWNITWLEDGTYRLSPMSDNKRALYIYNATATIGQVQMSDWSGLSNEEWVLTAQGNNTYRVGPRNAWSRVMTVYEMTQIVVIDYSSSGDDQNWILRSV